MNLQTYRQHKEWLKSQIPKQRSICETCRQVDFGCFCEFVKPFDSGIQFVILIHPIEVKRRIATGRMAHLCLKNSKLIKGENFSESREIIDLIADSRNQCVVLYPGPRSVNLSSLSESQRASHVDADKNLVIFVIDGTWSTARRMIRSDGLRSLPRVCFEPTHPSRFRVRKQPSPECHSTIEAIHQTIELLGPVKHFDLEARAHDNLLNVFESMVEYQLRFVGSKVVSEP